MFSPRPGYGWSLSCGFVSRILRTHPCLRAGAYAVRRNTVHQDLHCGPIPNPLSLVVCELYQRLILTVGGCLNARIFTLQLVRGNDLHVRCIFVTTLVRWLAPYLIDFQIIRVHRPQALHNK